MLIHHFKIALAAFLLYGVTSPALANSLPATNSPGDSGQIYFHLNFPVLIGDKTESISLNENYKDLLMSNFVAGALYVHLLNKHFPKLKYDRQYIEGSLLAQLLQENLSTSDYRSESDWINPDPAIRTMLLASGQGGPYQLNDYSKRLEHNVGMINFAVLQKSLGYTIQEQDSGEQTRKTGPLPLDNKYFAPLAATYFQYNDMLRIQKINQDPWGPSAQYFEQCMTNLENTPDNFLDMMLNAVYNAGPWAEITKTTIELCANMHNPAYADKIKHINDYDMVDSAYQQAIGTKERPGTTFILYPRQIRYYLDELYNNPTNLHTNNSLMFPVSQLKLVFSKSMATLAYVNTNGSYDFIGVKDAESAFDQAMSTLHISMSQVLNIGNHNERNQIFDLLDSAVNYLASALHIDFTEVTEKNLNGYHQ